MKALVTPKPSEVFLDAIPKHRGQGRKHVIAGEWLDSAEVKILVWTKHS